MKENYMSNKKINFIGVIVGAILGIVVGNVLGMIWKFILK